MSKESTVRGIENKKQYKKREIKKYLKRKYGLRKKHEEKEKTCKYPEVLENKPNSSNEMFKNYNSTKLAEIKKLNLHVERTCHVPYKVHSSQHQELF